MNQKLMKAVIIHGGNILIRLIIWTFCWIGLLIINEVYFNQNEFLFFSFLACLIVPWALSNKIFRKRYYENIEIKLDYDSWSFFVCKKEIEKEYKLDSIKSYWIAESSSGNSYGLSFKSISNHSKRIYFAFSDKKQSEDQPDVEVVLESFQSMIKNYNRIVDKNKQILFTQTFAESIYGLVAIYILTAMLIVAIYLHLIYNNLGMLPVSLLLGGGVLLRLIAQRKNEIKRRKNVT